MKRFFEEAVSIASGRGWGVALDGKPLATPGRAALEVPTRGLADAIAAEWNGQEVDIDPSAMPLTGLANAAIDRIAPDPAPHARDVARYCESDLTCYRAEQPVALVARQAESWNPLLDWARETFGVELEVITGIVHRAQPEASVARLGEEVAALDAFRLAALTPLVTIGGSLVAALALVSGAFEEDAVWAAVTVDEDWQAGQWGADAGAIVARDSRRRDFAAATRMWRLLEG